MKNSSDTIFEVLCATIVTVEKQCVTYSECVIVALGIRHTIRMNHIVVCDLPRSTLFFSDVVSQTAIFGGKKELPNTKCVFWFSLQLISHSYKK
jgi:hypothetical protein